VISWDLDKKKSMIWDVTDGRPRKWGRNWENIGMSLDTRDLLFHHVFHPTFYGMICFSWDILGDPPTKMIMILG
jgi:hypothetical protein